MQVLQTRLDRFIAHSDSRISDMPAAIVVDALGPRNVERLQIVALAQRLKEGAIESVLVVDCRLKVKQGVRE